MPHLCQGVALAVEPVDAAVHCTLSHEGRRLAVNGPEERVEVLRAAASGLDTSTDTPLDTTHHPLKLLLMLLLCELRSAESLLCL
jgi:hypothetical protein